MSRPPFRPQPRSGPRAGGFHPPAARPFVKPVSAGTGEEETVQEDGPEMGRQMGPEGRMVAVEHTGTLPWVQLRNATFHPLIFRKMVGRLDPKARPGDLVTVYDRDGKLFGTGFYNPTAQIGVRMLSFDKSEITEQTIIERLASAVALRRETLGLDATTSAYRVVHAEGDGLPGLIVDRLGEYAVIELFSFAMYRRAGVLSAALKEMLGVKEVLVRADERIEETEGFKLASGPTGAQRDRSADRKSTIITENGVKFQIDLTHGHKTGFFCDQRDNRLRLTRYTKDQNVLDMCAYSGGFGVYAAVLGGAKSVVAVDLDEDAIALAQRNANINKVPRAKYETVHTDSFPYLRQMQQNGKQFDVIVLDPPKLIPTRDDFGEGRAKYFDLNKLGLSVVRPGGVLCTCSCSGLVSGEEFFNIIRGAARSANRRVQVIEATGPGADHPVMTDCPESGYLKCLWCRVW